MKNPSASAKILRAICLAIAFLWSAPYLFFYIFGKNIMIDNLARITGRTVTAGAYSLTPQFGMRLDDVHIGNLGWIKSLYVQPRMTSLVAPQFVFEDISLEQPELTIYRTLAMISITQRPQEPSGQPHQQTQPVVALRAGGGFHIPWDFPIVVRRFKVNAGTVHWVDKMVKPEGVVITINDFNVEIKNFAAAYPAITQFSAQGTIPWSTTSARGKVVLDGWINFCKNDIQSRFSVSDIDAVVLQPYYAKYFDLEKARINKADLHFSTDIQGLDNDVSVKCRLQLTNVQRSQRGPDQPREKEERIADVVMSRLKESDGDNIHLEFSFKTRMDRPEFGLGIMKNAVETKLSRGGTGSILKPEGLLMFPGRLLVGVVMGVTDVSKGMIDGGFAVGNEFKKAVSASFEKAPAQ